MKYRGTFAHDIASHNATCTRDAKIAIFSYYFYQQILYYMQIGSCCISVSVLGCAQGCSSTYFNIPFVIICQRVIQITLGLCRDADHT